MNIINICKCPGIFGFLTVYGLGYYGGVIKYLKNQKINKKWRVNMNLQQIVWLISFDSLAT